MEQTSKRWNVVFIMTDQQRADSIGAGRHPCANYPNMERLSQESVRFKNCYTAAMPCVPSRHSYLTGRQPWILGCSGNGKFSMGEQDITWMSILREQGYRCVSVGKTHMIHSGSYHIPVPVGKSFGSRDGWDHFHVEETPETDDNYFDIHVTSRACDALDRLNDGNPFAMFIGFHAPHEPYVMPGKYLGYCKPEDVQIPKARCEGEYEGKSVAYRRRVELFRKKFGDVNDDMVRTGIAGHHCLLKMVDDCLGTVMHKLKELNLLDNTLIVYTADHGDLLGEHWIFNKAGSFYESEIHIPLLLRFPDGYKAGSSCNALVSTIDFVPTLLDIMGIRADVSLPGHSLKTAIDKGDEVRKYVTCAVNGAMMLRDKRYKLWYDSVAGDGEMYDLQADPMELDNLYGKVNQSELQFRLIEAMLKVRMADDVRNNRPTEKDKLLKREVGTSYEPEVVI